MFSYFPHEAGIPLTQGYLANGVWPQLSVIPFPGCLKGCLYLLATVPSVSWLGQNPSQVSFLVGAGTYRVSGDSGLEEIAIFGQNSVCSCAI